MISNSGVASAALLLEILHKKFDHVVTIHIFEWRLTGGVMAARQDYGFKIGAIFAEPCFSLTGELRQKCEIVTRVDEKIFLGIAREFIEIGHWAYALP